MKLQNPFGNNRTIWITQTYHEGGNNIAIDCITDGTTSGTPIYAMSNGTVTVVSKTAGSYLCKTIDGANFSEFYVHTARWVVKKGQTVKTGDLLGYIATQAENGGYPMHLHIGLSTGNYIMNYFDRGINFKTQYQDIANDWFNGDINNPINWSLFQDLQLGEGFNNGDRIIFTGEQNIRVGSGLQYDVQSSTYDGMKATIIGNSRIADGYTWYDIRVDGGGTGWVADVNKFRKLTNEDSNNNNGSDNVPPSMDDVQNLQQEIEKLKGELDKIKNDLRLSTERCDYLEKTNQELALSAKGLEGELEKNKQELAVSKQTVLDLQEKLSEQKVIDDYSTTELLREIVKRIFTS